MMQEPHEMEEWDLSLVGLLLPRMLPVRDIERGRGRETRCLAVMMVFDRHFAFCRHR